MSEISCKVHSYSIQYVINFYIMCTLSCSDNYALKKSFQILPHYKNNIKIITIKMIIFYKSSFVMHFANKTKENRFYY